MDTYEREEFEAIDAMLKHAREYGLETEVVVELYREVRGDESPGLQDAIWTALAEWDL